MSAFEPLRPFYIKSKTFLMKQQRQSDRFGREMWEDRLCAVTSWWRVILLLGGVGAVLLAAGLFVARTSGKTATQEVGQVVRFGSYATDEGDQPLVIVRLRDGRVRQFYIHRAQLRTCRVGDRIRLVSKGDWLGVHLRACLPD